MERDPGIFEFRKTPESCFETLPHRRGCGIQNYYYSIKAIIPKRPIGRSPVGQVGHERTTMALVPIICPGFCESPHAHQPSPFAHCSNAVMSRLPTGRGGGRFSGSKLLTKVHKHTLTALHCLIAGLHPWWLGQMLALRSHLPRGL